MKHSNIKANRYGLHHRPIMLGAIPSGFLQVPGSSRSQPDYSERCKFGYVFYAEPLSEQCQKDFELTDEGQVELAPNVTSDTKVYDWTVIA